MLLEVIEVAFVNIGDRFGTVIIIGYALKSKYDETQYECLCDCGKLIVIKLEKFLSGKNKEKTFCKHKLIEENNYNIGKEYEHTCWKRMHGRCSDQNDSHYKNYGERGIRVCERWSSFEDFYLDMGPRSSFKHSIERINNDGNYCPENCKWATAEQQANNTRRNRIVEFNGEKMTLSQLSKKTGIGYKCLYGRLRRGMTIEEALVKRMS